MAEQVLEQITEELALLGAENRFLSKLNQRLTYHAYRQEKYFLDVRKSRFEDKRKSSSYIDARQSSQFAESMMKSQV